MVAMTAVVPFAGSCALGAFCGFGSISQARRANQAYQGKELPRLLFEQVGSNIFALQVVLGCGRKLGYFGAEQKLPLLKGIIPATFLPILINLGISRVDEKSYPALKHRLLQVDHALCYIGSGISLISSVALCILGQPLAGGVSLAFFAHEICYLQGWLPSWISTKINLAGRIGSGVYLAFLSPDLGSRIMGVVLLTFQVLTLLFTKIWPKKPEAGLPRPTFSILSPVPSLAQLKIDPGHLKWRPPVSKQASLRTLQTLFQEYDLSQEPWKGILYQLVGADPNYRHAKLAFEACKPKEEADKHRLRTEKMRIEYVKEGLDCFVKAIEGLKRVEELDSREVDVQELRALAGSLAAGLQEEKARLEGVGNDLNQREKNVFRTKCFTSLLRLALVTKYCGPKWKDETRTAHAFCVGDVETEVMQALIEERRLKFSRFAASIENRFVPMERLGYQEDLHTHNDILRWVGSEFSLPEEVDAQQDINTQDLDPVETYKDRIIGRLLLWCYYKTNPDNRFYRTVERAISLIQENLTTHVLTKDDKRMALEQWYAKEYLKVCPESKRTQDQAIAWVKNWIYLPKAQGDFSAYTLKDEAVAFLLMQLGVLAPI